MGDESQGAASGDVPDSYRAVVAAGQDGAVGQEAGVDNYPIVAGHVADGFLLVEVPADECGVVARGADGSFAIRGQAEAVVSAKKIIGRQASPNSSLAAEKNRVTSAVNTDDRVSFGRDVPDGSLVPREQAERLAGGQAELNDFAVVGAANKC